MLRRIVLVAVVMVFTLKLFGQENTFIIPDYQEIEKLTADKGSAFYYDNIFKRYEANDTTLTLRDYRMLYYGYFFQPQYTPFYRSAETDSIKTLLGSKDELTKDDWKQIIRLGKVNIAQNPFDLKGLNVVWIAYRQSGDTATANLYFDKLKKLVQTILATGDGKSEKTAFHVLNVSHEYDIVSILGYEFAGNQKLTDAKCDFLSLKDNDDRVTGLYFDVKQIFKGYERSLSSKAP